MITMRFVGGLATLFAVMALVIGLGAALWVTGAFAASRDDDLRRDGRRQICALQPTSPSRTSCLDGPVHNSIKPCCL